MRSVAICFLLAPLAIPMTAAAEVRYTVTNLGLQPAAINYRGQIVGTAEVSGASHAALYDGTFHDLGVPPGDAGASAVAISQQGLICANVATQGQPPNLEVWLYQDRWLRPPQEGTMRQVPTGINSLRHIVGFDEISPGAGFYFDGKTYNYEIDHFPFFQYVGAINDHDQFTGQTTVGNRPFIADAKAGTAQFLQRDDGKSVSGAGTAINESGDVAGSYTPPGANPQFASHAFLYAKGVFTDIAGWGGLASGRGVNDSDQVVGYSSLAYGVPPFHAFLYDGSIHDLNGLVDPGSGWLLEKSFGINDAGEIIGTGTFMGQANQGFLLTPIPEPGSVAALIGMAALLGRRRRYAFLASVPHSGHRPGVARRS